MNDMIGSAFVALFVGVTSVTNNFFAQVSSAQFDWGNMIEKGGTIAVLIWTVLYFQRRSDAMTLRLEDLARRSLDLVEKSAVANQEVANALKELRAVIERCKVHGHE